MITHPCLYFNGKLTKLTSLMRNPDVSLVNSSHPSAVYIRQWTGSTLVPIMACHLFSAKPIAKPMLAYCQFDKFQWNVSQNTSIFIQANAFENIACKTVAILSRRRRVNPSTAGNVWLCTQHCGNWYPVTCYDEVCCQYFSSDMFVYRADDPNSVK